MLTIFMEHKKSPILNNITTFWHFLGHILFHITKNWHFFGYIIFHITKISHFLGYIYSIFIGKSQQKY